MKLFYSPNSPYARKARIVIREKSIAGVEEILVNTADNSPELLAINPLGTVPTFLTDAGLHLCESPIICEFLDSLPSSAPLLISNDFGARLCILSLAALGDGIMDAAVTMVMESRRPPEKQMHATIERKEKAVLRAIEKIASAKLDYSFPLTMGTLNVAVALLYIDFRLPHLAWRIAHPEMAVWVDGLDTTESFATTRPA